MNAILLRLLFGVCLECFSIRLKYSLLAVPMGDAKTENSRIRRLDRCLSSAITLEPQRLICKISRVCVRKDPEGQHRGYTPHRVGRVLGLPVVRE
ncbi:hypothetical protein BOTBODRAFT_36464 [Botryobasidium botryosum FD-172 SS1]|uniref:Secreted protein n=1 Tax=Botryobasidium botryosum (strain FD-172 SS1) TaxID=930990 RepID=A0A067MF07_BOTB1|nr:hypothetical protein BOTBODRAFT_36464 [Botryobasidium botryosum FD-172 SS1]